MRRTIGGSAAAKRQKDLGQSAGIEESAKAIRTAPPANAAIAKDVPIDTVRRDPNNPRELHIESLKQLQDLLENLESIQDPRLKKEVSHVQGLAKSIAGIGQRQPCEVVRQGSNYQLVYGERRWWACQLAGMKTLKVLVLHQAPDNVKLVQFVENMQRRNLPLYQTIKGLRAAVGGEATKVKDVKALMELTGLSSASAYRYFEYLTLDDYIDQALDNGVISNHRDLSRLLQFKGAERKRALKRFRDSGSFEEKEPTTAGGSTKTVKTKKKGRPTRRITFGHTTKLPLAQAIIRRLDADGAYGDIDWNDPKALNAAWKGLLKVIEEQLDG